MRNLTFIAAMALATAIAVPSPASAADSAFTQQTAQPTHKSKKKRTSAKPSTGEKKTLSPQQQFVLDTVRSAVSRVSDPLNRLRVLDTAVRVVMPVDPKLARAYADEGVRLESQLINDGEKPPVSLMESGLVGCARATEFIENLPAQHLHDAEQAVIGAAGVCPKALEAAQNKYDAGVAQHESAPRALMAIADHSGDTSPWSRTHFEQLASNLPDPEKGTSLAPEYANAFAQLAPQMDRSTVKKVGIELLDWLAKMNDAPEKQLAIQSTAGAMKQVLGEKAYSEALADDVIAQQTAQQTGNAEITPDDEEDSVSVLGAMQNKGQDRTDELQELPARRRAEEAAAAAFANAGDKNAASKYLDMAFRASDEAWSQQEDFGKSAAPVVEQVCEAAAQVDYVDALKRAEGMEDPAEQAIGMLAVAQTVLSKASQ